MSKTPMSKTFTGLAILLLATVLAQFFLAASGAFGGGPDGKSFRPHHALGYVLFFLPLAMTAVAALARLPARLIGVTALTAALDAVQVLIAKLAEGLGDQSSAAQLTFGLHALNGLLILAVAGLIVRQSWTLAARATPTSADVKDPVM